MLNTLKLTVSAAALLVLAACGGGGGSTGSNNTGGTPPAPTLNSIAVTPAAPTAPVNQTVQFTATGTYSDNTTKTTPELPVIWNSTNTSVATITQAGLATTIQAGTAVIRATSTTSTILGTAILTVP